MVIAAHIKIEKVSERLSSSSVFISWFLILFNILFIALSSLFEM